MAHAAKKVLHLDFALAAVWVEGLHFAKTVGIKTQRRLRHSCLLYSSVTRNFIHTTNLVGISTHSTRLFMHFHFL